MTNQILRSDSIWLIKRFNLKIYIQTYYIDIVHVFRCSFGDAGVCAHMNVICLYVYF